MKYLFFFIIVVIYSCSANVEKKCFIENEEKTYYVEEKPYTEKQILAEKPEYLEIINLKEYRTFNEDSLYTNHDKWENYDKHESEYKIFKEKFSDQFTCFAIQKIENTQFCLGRNLLGYWLLKIEKNKPTAYFLGLSFSHYYFNEIQTQPIIKDGFLQLQGSLVKIVKVEGLPGYDDYSAIAEGKLFKMNLEEILKDSDKDGYNDVFENSFGLNAKSADTDQDGVNDFDDLNPMFKSKKNKFTQLYEMLLPDYGSEDLTKENYYFEIFKSDCEYFHQINPRYHVLFIPENEKEQANYLKITDVTRHGISKMKINKTDPNIFYIEEWGSSSSTHYSVEYKGGKWILETTGGYVI